MDQDTKKKWVLRVILQAQQTVCHKDQPLQHLHIHCRLEDHHGFPQSTISTQIARIYQNAMDPPEHLWIIKAQELLKEGTRHQNLTLEHHQVQVLLHSMLNHLRTLSCVQHVAKVAIGAEIALITIFVTFAGSTTHSTHMCRAAECGTRSPVCIYCGKTNHSSAYCRYRPRDNREEPRNTPDALKTGTTGENLATVARNQTGSTHHNTNKAPFSHLDDRGQNQPNGGQHRPQHREQTSAAPRGQTDGY